MSKGDRKSLNFIGTDMMLMSAQCTNLVAQPHSHPASQVMPEVPTRVGANMYQFSQQKMFETLNKLRVGDGWEMLH